MTQIPEPEASRQHTAVTLIDTGLPQPADEAAWLAARREGIGASEASAIVGKNPYMSNEELWEIKTGRRQAADISNQACVQYGHAAEAPIRELFALDHPEYAVQYGGAPDRRAQGQTQRRRPPYPHTGRRDAARAPR